MAFYLPIPADLNDPLLGFRFAVVFLGNLGPAHSPEFRFKSVQGLTQGVEFEQAHGIPYPTKQTSENLILERGMPLVSTYRLEVQESFQNFQFKPRNLILTILNEEAIPINSYLFYEAFPIQWSLSGLDASTNEVVVESLTLTYKRFKSLLL